MAKKKSKKNTQKQVEIASPPASPKSTPVSAVEEAVPEVTEPLQLAPEASAVDLVADKQPDTAAAPPEVKIDKVVEGSTSTPAIQGTTDLEVPPPKEQEPTESSIPKDEVITETIAEPATKSHSGAVEASQNDSSVANELEEVTAEATTGQVEQHEENVATEPSKPIAITEVPIEPEIVAEPTVEIETETVRTPVQEVPKLVSEPPAEQVQGITSTQQHIEAPEIVRESKTPLLEEPIEAGASGPLEESQSTIAPTEEVPAETVRQAPTGTALPETQESIAEDEWAVTSKKGKKGKKEKKTKRQTLTSAGDGTVEPSKSGEAEPLAYVPTEEQKGEHDAMHLLFNSSN